MTARKEPGGWHGLNILHFAAGRIVAEGVHDGKLGGARAAGQAVAAFVVERRQEGGPAGDGISARGGGIRRSGLPPNPPGMAPDLRAGRGGGVHCPAEA